jgi:hypothetical protein
LGFRSNGASRSSDVNAQRPGPRHSRRQNRYRQIDCRSRTPPEGAEAGKVVLLAHAETYVSGRIEALAADAIANVVAREVPFSTGRQALFDSSVAIVIDGVSEIPEASRAALQDDLRTLVAAGRGARVLLLGRDIAALREVQPASLMPATYLTVDLGQEQRLDLGHRVVRSLTDSTSCQGGIKSSENVGRSSGKSSGRRARQSDALQHGSGFVD